MRVLILLLLVASLGLIFGGRAAATTEFCPAVLDYAPVGSHATAAQTYGIQLRALSERQITARVVFDTSDGWFTADLPQANLTSSIRTIPLKYPVDIGLAASPIMFVRFPKSVAVNHAFVTGALSYGDIFHWSDRGQVTCPIAPESWPDPKYSLADENGLSSPPDRGATFVTAKTRSPLESPSCTDAFSSAKPLKVVNATYPDAARAVGATGSIVIGTAVDPNGSVADTWVQGSSNDATLDAAAQAAAQATTFQGARAYCQSVPSIFYFVVTFAGN